MLKLMKYEIRKQMFSKVIILVILAMAEAVFIAAVLFNKEAWMAVGVGALMMLASLATFFVSFESIITFSNDLKTKQSYMLFLTPNSAYSIMGAKVISSALQILFTAAMFLAVAIGDIVFLAVRFNDVSSLIDGIKSFISQMTGFEVHLQDIILLLLIIVLSWISTIVFALLSITLSTTLLENKKFKWVISFITFCLINVVVYKGMYAIVNSLTTVFTTSSWIICVYTLVVTVLAYVATAWMLDKKVSV